MLQLFRTNQFFANILLLFYIIALRLFVFFVPIQGTESGGGAWSLELRAWLPASGWTAEVFVILLIFIQAVLLNYLTGKYRTGKEVTLFPGLLYVLLVMSLPEFAQWSPALIANTFLLLALVELFSTYKRSIAASEIFNIGLSIAVASLFYPAYLWFFFMLFIGLSIMRSFRFREQLMLVIGFLVPFFLSSVYYFWMEDLIGFWQHQWTDSWGFLNIQGAGDWVLYLKLGYFALLLLICLFSYQQYLQKKNIQVQKQLNIMYWVLFFAGLSLLFHANAQMDHLLSLAPSLAVFLSLSLMNMTPSRAELFHFFLLFSALFFQYAPILLGR